MSRNLARTLHPRPSGNAKHSRVSSRTLAGRSESLTALAAQVADLRGQVHAINGRLDQAGLRAEVNLAARFENLARTVAGALPPRPRPGAGVPRPLAARDQAPHHRHHPHRRLAVHDAPRHRRLGRPSWIPSIPARRAGFLAHVRPVTGVKDRRTTRRRSYYAGTGESQIDGMDSKHYCEP